MELTPFQFFRNEIKEKWTKHFFIFSKAYQNCEKRVNPFVLEVKQLKSLHSLSFAL